MTYVRLDRIAGSKGSHCTVTINTAEWQCVRIFGPIKNMTEDANKVLVIEAPLTTSPKNPGFLHSELKNERAWKGLKIICSEPVLVFGNNDTLSINAGASWNPVIEVYRASSVTTAIKDYVKIEE
jgi:hypothetical protein